MSAHGFPLFSTDVAVRRLRALLEDDPARPTRIVTTDAGYALGATEPLRRWDPPVSAT